MNTELTKTKSFEDITKSFAETPGFAHLADLTEVATGNYQSGNVDGVWSEDEHGGAIVNYAEYRKLLKDEERQKAIKMHGNDPNKRLDLAGFPIRDRVFMMTYDYGNLAHPTIDFSTLAFDWLYLFGYNGNGKTTVACRLAWEWMEKDPLREATFLSVVDWIHNLKKPEDESIEVELPRLKQFVILDDFDKVYYPRTEWQANQLFRLVDHLYRKDSHVIITANRSLDGIVEASDFNIDMQGSSDRIMGRIEGEGIVFKQDSFRRSK